MRLLDAHKYNIDTAHMCKIVLDQNEALCFI